MGGEGGLRSIGESGMRAVQCAAAGMPPAWEAHLSLCCVYPMRLSEAAEAERRRKHPKTNETRDCA